MAAKHLITLGGRLRLGSFKLGTSVAGATTSLEPVAGETLWPRLLLLASFMVVLVWLVGLGWLSGRVASYVVGA